MEKITTELFRQRAYDKFGDKFDLSGVEYVNKRTRISVTCPLHGVFEILPLNFLNSKCGCPSCSHKSAAAVRGEKSRMTTDEFIEKASKVHGGRYDYSKVEYVNSNTKVCIKCPVHGEFWQLPSNHLQGMGCRKCGRESIRESTDVLTCRFIEKAIAVHGDKYDYSKVEYKNAYTDVCIICKKHGEFLQSPHNHLRGHGCPFCANKYKTTCDFVTMARKVHGDKYDYSNVEYVNSQDKVEIKCPRHGSFLQAPFNHLQGHGCPKCSILTSKWENEIYEFICSLGIECEHSDRHQLGGHEIDILIPSYEIGIECDGLYWHSDVKRGKYYHLLKTNTCHEAGIRLVHVFEDEWAFKGDIVRSMLRNMLGKTEHRIFARKCDVRYVDASERRKFLDDNHIQGNAQSKIDIGLYYEGELVSLMTFGKPRINVGGRNSKYEYELVRFANKKDTLVIGGASKLFKWFLERYKPKGVISYSDKRWSVGKLYDVLGFRHDHDSPPNYFYVDGMRRLNRFGFRKSVLVKEGFDADKSESEIMTERGFKRIYDCGTMVWIYKEGQS